MSDHQTMRAIVLPPGGGRVYELGAMRAVFKADRGETADRYSVSEWWLDPHSTGPGAHKHEENDELFYVLAGCMSVLVGNSWVDASAGSFIFIPRGTLHDFENRGDERAGLFNVFIPGPFEQMMPAIVKWFEDKR